MRKPVLPTLEGPLSQLEVCTTARVTGCWTPKPWVISIRTPGHREWHDATANGKVKPPDTVGRGPRARTDDRHELTQAKEAPQRLQKSLEGTDNLVGSLSPIEVIAEWLAESRWMHRCELTKRTEAIGDHRVSGKCSSLSVFPPD